MCSFLASIATAFSSIFSPDTLCPDRFGVTPVRSVHLTELRAALDAVYDAAGRPRPNYTDADVTAGVSVVKAAHVTELREAVEVVASPSPSLDSFYTEP